MFILVIIIYIVLLTLELIPLYKNKIWKDFYLNLSLGFFSFIIALLISLHVNIPSPAKAIEKVILSLFGG